MTSSTVARHRSAPKKADPQTAEAVASGSLRHYLGVTLSAAALLLVLALAVVTIALPAAVGGRPFTVLTQSMEPGLPPGTLIVTHPVDPADIRIGDVLTYQMHSGEPAVISHRVIEKSVSGDGSVSFVTKGDNNDLPDEAPVLEVQVVGTVWYSVPLLGWVNNAINGDARAVLVPIAVALLFGYAAWMLFSGVRDRVRKGSRRERSQDR